MKTRYFLISVLVGFAAVVHAQDPAPQKVTAQETELVCTGGTISYEQDATYITQFKLTATADAVNGYSFQQWADGNTDNPRTVNALEGPFQAVFVYEPALNFTDGRVEVAVTNTTAPLTYTLTAVACDDESANTFSKWSNNSTDNPLTYHEADCNITPIYRSILHEQSGDVTMGHITCTSLPSCGYTLTAVPEEGYHFVKWEDNSTDVTRDVKYKNAAYTATFEIDQLELYDDVPAGQELEDAQAAMRTTLEAWKGKTTDVIIHRTLWRDGYYNTLCLPFDLASLDGTPLAGGQLMEYTGADVYATTLDVHIKEATSITAYKPYLISFAQDENITSMTFTNVTIESYKEVGVQAGEGVNFLATITPTKLAKGDESLLFVAANNMLNWPSMDDQSTMKGFRAYFKVNDTSTAQVIRRGMPAQLVVGSRQTPTGLESLSGLSRDGVRKVLHDNRILIIRNGVVYDAIGNKQVK